MASELVRRNGGEPVDRFVRRCTTALETLYSTWHLNCPDADVYSHSVRWVTRLIAVLLAARQIPPSRAASAPIRAAAAALDNASLECLMRCLDDSAAASGLSIFRPTDTPTEALEAAARLITAPDEALEPVFFESMPLWWLGRAYQGMLAYRPSGETLEPSRSLRKKAGVYFTPAHLVDYVVEAALSPLPGRAVAVLDPAMGCGAFLSAAVSYLAGGEDAARVARECIYGIDIDSTSVEIARFCVWAAAGYPDGIAPSLERHLICANAMGEPGGEPFDWRKAFPDVPDGFDAVLGNPPYIASKNGLKPPQSTRGQSDTYLMFLSATIDSGLVRPEGMLSMVLPDPMLARSNAVAVRRTLASDWSLVSLLHILGAFPEAGVANLVPVCRNAPAREPVFTASRIERAADRKAFLQRPTDTARRLARPVRLETVLSQKRCEFLYLLEEGRFREVLRLIHGNNIALSQYDPPFEPLSALNVASIYRGEEVGKAAIGSEAGDMPILLGGQSVQPFEIIYEGRRMNRSRIKKPVERYLSTKILVQKSSARLVAALDRVGPKHAGYVFPQSVYAVELRDPGMDPLYLLCLLNSEVFAEYIHRTVTGYKLLQPQLEIEDIRGLPIRRVSFTTPHPERQEMLSRGLNIFESESRRTAESLAFPELDAFAEKCLAANPEMSDVIHDLLVHLGRWLVDLTASSRRDPDAAVEMRLKSVKAAVETLVWRLYSSRPAQMSLPW